MDEKVSPSKGIVFTLDARCRDCYRCVRVCPVKAIRMTDGQAHVDETRCIACGTCIRECPQKAKTFRNDLEKAQKLVKEHEGPVAASVAPSIAGLFGPKKHNRFVSALRRLGFQYVGETATGAYHVALESAKHAKKNPDKAVICTACPALVNYITRYRPELVDNLAPVVSPMIAHGIQIKQHLGPHAKTVFIGPCVAKKDEAGWDMYDDIIDVVLTFKEVDQWFAEEGIKVENCEESDFDDMPEGKARLFPLEGGLLKTAALEADGLNERICKVHGTESINAALDSIKNAKDSKPLIIEPLFCANGCINGPGLESCHLLFDRRQEVISFANKPATPAAKARKQDKTTSLAAPKNLSTRFEASSSMPNKEFSEEEIATVLEQTGKASEDQHLNCGACGYNTCRDKAIAVLNGMAELEMCVPYMRQLAEQRTDKIISTSPNGIVIVNPSLEIISMNPAFRKLFRCTDAVLGKNISYLIDPEPFEKLQAGQTPKIVRTGTHTAYNLVCHEIFYPLHEEGQLVGIFVDITRHQQDQTKLRQIRSKTLEQARNLLDHQISTAQQIAKFLGETTAQGEDIINKLMNLPEDGHDA